MPTDRLILCNDIVNTQIVGRQRSTLQAQPPGFESLQRAPSQPVIVDPGQLAFCQCHELRSPFGEVFGLGSSIMWVLRRVSEAPPAQLALFFDGLNELDGQQFGRIA